MNTKKNSHNIVLICDRVSNRNGINLYSDNLEFTSNTYFNAISNALKECSSQIYFYEKPSEFMDNIGKHKDDIIISAIWSGTKSRNRKSLIAAICEAYNIKYVGADTYVQSLCQDKQLSKVLVEDTCIKAPRGVLFSPDHLYYDNLDFLNFPIIVKPNLEGSSIGISDNSIADTKEHAIQIIKNIVNVFPSVLAEEYIPGREISICCVGRNTVDLMEAVELQIDGENYFEKRIWGYESKKGGKCKVTREVVTSQIPQSILDSAQKIFLSLGKVDYMRIDGRLYNDQFYLIEFTPDCSLHPDCFMYEAFKHNGYSYNEMIAALVNLY